jgi:choice-of-anchor C domain-containing protein
MRQRSRGLFRTLGVVLAVCFGLASCGSAEATVARSLASPSPRASTSTSATTATNPGGATASANPIATTSSATPGGPRPSANPSGATPGANASASTSNNPVSLGDFECPPVSGSQTFPAGQAICGWAVKEGSVDVVGNLWTATQGVQSVHLAGAAGPGKIEQYINTTPGRSYRIRYALAGNVLGGPAEKKLLISFEGRDIATETFSTTGRTATAMGWVYKEHTVTANSAALALVFSSASAGAFGPVIDDVSVVPTGSAADGPLTGAVAVPAIAEFAVLSAARRRPALTVAAVAG